jgi:luciferase family oxidoreductase group 1
VLALRGASGDTKAADDIARILGEIEGFGEVAPTPFPADHPLHAVIASPEGVAFPPIFLLGSGQLSAKIAAARGRGFASAYFFSPEESEAAIRAYKETFQPSAHFERPHAILTVGVICAETEELAADLARASQLTALRRLNDERDGYRFASIEEGRAAVFSAEDEEKLRRFRPIVGTPAQIHAELTQLAAQLGADELMITTAVGDHELRRRSYELVAEVFGLVELA